MPGFLLKKELFEELLASVREGGSIMCGQRRPSRVFSAEEPDARTIREFDCLQFNTGTR
jgi:hypothetical protein